MTKRQMVLERIRLAAYQGDMQTAQRLYIENRISRNAYEEAVAIGIAQRELSERRK